MAIYLSKKFGSPEEFETWIEENEHGNKDFLDKLCEQDKEKWDKKACKMTVKDGKLQLLCEDGNVLAEANYYQPDGDTVCCDGENGELCIKGIQNANEPNGKKFRVWVGTQEEYNAIRVKDPRTMYYITDETLLDDILSGLIKVGHAKKADSATTADTADSATSMSTLYVSDIDELTQLVQDYQGRTFSLIFTGRLEFRNKDGLLIWVTKQNDTGVYTIANGTATLTHIGTSGIENAAIYSDGVWKSADPYFAEESNYAYYAERASCDENNNKINETYGNFAGEWQAGNLTSTGVYLFDVEYSFMEDNYGAKQYRHRATVLVYFDSGMDVSVVMANDFFKDNDFWEYDTASLDILTTGAQRVQIKGMNSSDLSDIFYDDTAIIKWKKIWG